MADTNLQDGGCGRCDNLENAIETLRGRVRAWELKAKTEADLRLAAESKLQDWSTRWDEAERRMAAMVERATTAESRLDEAMKLATARGRKAGEANARAERNNEYAKGLESRLDRALDLLRGCYPRLNNEDGFKLSVLAFLGIGAVVERRAPESCGDAWHRYHVAGTSCGACGAI